MIHNHIVNQRADYLHKTSAEIAKRYNVICEYAVHVKQRVWKWEIDDEYSYGKSCTCWRINWPTGANISSKLTNGFLLRGSATSVGGYTS